MDPVVNHEQIAELLGAYALDAVDPDEAELVARHLVECPRCAAEVDEHRGTASLLANRGSDAPTDLWDRISAQIQGVPDGAPGRPGLTAVGGGPVVGVAPVLHTTDGPAAGTAWRGSSGHRWGWRIVPPLVAAAAVVIALLAVQVGRLDGRVGRLSALAARQGMPALAEQALADPLAERVALVDATASGRTVGDLVILPTGAAFLVEGDLPPLPAGRTYQLWGMSDGQAVSLGLLGRHPQVVAFSLGASAPVTAFAVTAEPAGGVVVSTGPAVAEGSVRSA